MFNVIFPGTVNTITLDAFGRIREQSEHTITNQSGVFDTIRAYTYTVSDRPPHLDTAG